MRFDGPLLSPRTPTRALPSIKTGPQQVRCRPEWPGAPLASAGSVDRGGREALLPQIVHHSTGFQTAAATAAAAVADCCLPSVCMARPSSLRTDRMTAPMQHVLQARRRQRIVRSVLAAAALLVAGHYASLLVRVQSCHRSGGGGGVSSSSSNGRLASAPHSGADADAPGAAAWPVEGGSGHVEGSGKTDSAGVGGMDDAGGTARDPRGGGRHSIPRILHQSWKDEHVPKRFHKWQAKKFTYKKLANVWTISSPFKMK